MRRVAGVDSRANEATKGRPGEENGRVEVKDSRRGGTDGVFDTLRKCTEVTKGESTQQWSGPLKGCIQ